MKQLYIQVCRFCRWHGDYCSAGEYRCNEKFELYPTTEERKKFDFINILRINYPPVDIFPSEKKQKILNSLYFIDNEQSDGDTIEFKIVDNITVFSAPPELQELSN
jgi:hypothetical protein